MICLAIALLILFGILYERHWRHAWFEAGYPPPSPIVRWATGIWAVLFGGYMVWVLAGWFHIRLSTLP
ncbi:MAG: hypothetical protein WBX26_14265 [Candidatus Cybelea sp.]